MSNPAPPPTAILYQNPARTITLLDIPLSISLAQGTSTQPNYTRKLFGNPPPQLPYQSTEPKSETAKANVIRRMGASESPFPVNVLREALKEIRENHEGEWCSRRQIATVKPANQGRKRKRGDEEIAGGGFLAVKEPTLQIPTYNTAQRNAGKETVLALSTSVVSSPDVGGIANRLVHNPHSTSLPLLVGSQAHTYTIPPGAAFYLANVDKRSISKFGAAAQGFFSTPSSSAGPGQFDFVLLDPPWENHSAKRSGKYRTLRQSRNPMLVLQDIFGQRIAPRGLVACWITNKPQVRKIALEAFETWGIGLVEEWAWLKVTVHGLPLADMEGLWRKPYEILLLGRPADSSAEDLSKTALCQSNVRKRTIVAVPDLHSRKPCIKGLIEHFMPDPMEYRALEIFARNLTSQWWSWGNEAMKYNWEGYWERND